MARFVVSRSKVLAQYAAVRELADAVSYSVKTNPLLVSLLEEKTDSFFGIHFIHSLSYVQNPSRVWFFAQGWTEQELNELFTHGVRSFVVDNENDLAMLLRYIEARDERISLLLRMRLKERTIHTERHFVFGFYAAQINEWIPKLRKNEKIARLGIHFHRKSENLSEWDFRDELGAVIDSAVLDSIDVLNMGGGIPVQYKNHPVDMLPHIFLKIRELREWLSERNVQLVIEPGRFIAAPCTKLEAVIRNIYGNTIIIDCSVYNAAMDTFVVPIRLLVEGEREAGEAYTVKGCTPDSLDVFRYRIYMDNPKIGDTIVFLNAGAYTYAADFCGLQKLETVFVD